MTSPRCAGLFYLRFKLTTITPTHDRIFVSRKAPETKTASGIVLPEIAGERPDEGVVIAVGPGKAFENGTIVALTVKVGDKILFNKHSGQTTKLASGEEVLVMREDDVFAIIED